MNIEPVADEPQRSIDTVLPPTRGGFVIGVGASAGGLEALQDFFAEVPASCRYSFVVIQHLSSDHKSLMVDLLSSSANLRVVEAADGMPVEPGVIYLIPPAHNLELDDRTLRLTERAQSHGLNLPIDIFFESLAREQRARSIGVILTGTGSDGSRGVRAIKDVGGMVMVQDPDQAEFDGMPRSALNTGVVDYTLPIREMPSEIDRFLRLPISVASDALEGEDELLALLISRVRLVAEVDFSQYKRPTLVRRIRRRMSVTKSDSLEAYLKLLHDDAREVELLARECLIGVTRFFRDRDVWELTSRHVLAPLVEQRANHPEQEIRIWSVGCSTGEEAYTAGILLLEELERQGIERPVKIFATDVSDQFLAIASKGEYPESIVADVDPDRLSRYFIKTGADYQVCNALRRLVIFSNHNVILNPPFKDVDLVICRNMLIYLERAAQLQAINSLHYALRPGGSLLLGPSEHVGDLKSSLRTINSKARLYENAKPSKGFGFGAVIRERELASRWSTRTSSIGGRGAEVLGEAVTESLGLAAVFVDDSFDILHAIGEIRKFVDLPVHGFTSNLLKLLDRDLSVAVSTAVRKAKLASTEVAYRGVRVVRSETARKIDLMVKPFVLEEPDRRQCFAVILLPGDEEQVEADITLDHTSDATGSRELQMEQELIDTRQSLQAAIEELETTNEELQASNEELMAANEELQSTNEELQSMNEELHTVNAEHQQKISELADLNTDMDNLLRSTEIGTIFLDEEMRIRKFTPVVQEKFNLQAIDIGRPLAHFASTFSSTDNTMLLDEAQAVLKSGKTSNVQVPWDEDRMELVKLAPFRDERGRVVGVVMSFIDVTELQQVQDKYADQNAMFQQVLEGAMAGYWDYRPDTGRFFMSPSFKAMLGLNVDEVENTVAGMRALVQGDDLDLVDSELERLTQRDSDGAYSQLDGEPYELETRFRHDDGSTVWVWCRGQLVAGADGSVRLIGCYVDITALKMIEADLLRSNDELTQFAYLTSHDLQEPLRTVSNFVEVLEKRYSEVLDDDGKQYLDIVMQATKRMQSLIRGILDYSRIGRDAAQELVDVGVVIESVVDDLDSAIAESGAQLEIKPMPKVIGYEPDLRMLFGNLISNAIKFRKPGVAPEIKLDVRRMDADRWRFSVSDNGIGISPDHQTRIFEIFNRLHTKDEFDGAGIGLAHARKIVELHGGIIFVESEVDIGSTFSFDLALG